MDATRWEEAGPASPSSSSDDRVPVWAWIAAAGLTAAGVVVLLLGRGGTPVLAGVVLLFAAVALLLASLPDRDPLSS
jgi:hypothetical protein